MGTDVAGTYYDDCYIACDAFSDQNGGVVIPYTGREMFNLPPKVLLCYEPTKKNKKKDAKRDRLINLLVQKLEEYHIEYTTDLKEISTVQMSIVFIDRSFVRNSHHLLDLFVEERKRSSMLYTAVWYANRESHIVRNLMSGGNNCPDLGWGLFFFKKKRCILGEAVGRFLYYLAKLKVKDIGIAFSENWEHIEARLGVFAQEVVNQLNPSALDFSGKLKSQLTDLSFQLYDQVVQNPKGPSLIAVIQGCHDGCGQLKVISNLLWTLINLRSAKRFFFCIHLSMDQQKHIGGRQRSLFNHFRKELCRKYRLKKLYSPLMIFNFFIVIDGFDDFLSEKEPDPAIMLAKFVKKIGRGSLVIATCREKTTAAIASLLTSEMPTQFHIEGTQCSTLSGPGTIKRHFYFTIPNTRLNQLVLEPELTEPTYSFLRDDGMDTYIPGEYEKIEAEESESPRYSFIDESGCRVIYV